MKARITSELSVGLTPEILAALEIATEFSGMKASQLARMALVEKLCRDGFLKHPGLTHMEKAAAKNPQPQLNPAA